MSNFAVILFVDGWYYCNIISVTNSRLVVLLATVDSAAKPVKTSYESPSILEEYSCNNHY